MKPSIWMTVIGAMTLVGCGSGLTAGYVTSGVQQTALQADTVFPGSGMYSFTVEGHGFDHHDGKQLYVVLLENGAAKVRGEVTVEAGAFSLGWHGVLQEGKTYAVSYYVDVNGNDACDAAPTDHVWHADVPLGVADVALGVQHSTTFAQACGDFPSGT
jgi:hypothetical protein